MSLENKKDDNNTGWYQKFRMQLLLPQNNNIYGLGSTTRADSNSAIPA